MADENDSNTCSADATFSSSGDRGRRWYARNIEAQRERCRLKREKNIEKYREYSRCYNAKNLPRLAAIARNRRSRQKNNGGSHTIEDIQRLVASQRNRCACCRKKLSSEYHVDHIVPLARGGANDKRNLQILCAPCNQRKSARDPIEFMQSRGYLL